jgi:hypothetical protein
MEDRKTAGMIFYQTIILGIRFDVKGKGRMNTNGNLISILELRRLLYTIVDGRLATCFRYRLLGTMWEPNFLRVVDITDNGVLLNDEQSNSYKCLTDLSQIMQFEIDVAVHNFLPHNHYEIDFAHSFSPSLKPQ